MRRYRIAAIPGDGIGKEVIPAGIEVLAALAGRDGDLAFDVEILPWGSDHYRATGAFMPQDGAPCCAVSTRSISARLATPTYPTI